LGDDALNKIVEYGLLNDNAVVIFEHFQDEKHDFTDKLEVIDERKYGTIIVTFMRVKND
jgi:16S rRNA G966 N2-methylase RsmD